MIKSTAKELKREAQFLSKNELIKFLKDNNLKVNVKYGKYPDVEKVAYCESVYGCGGYLVRYNLNNGGFVMAFTGRSSWMYSVENTNDLPVEVLESIK